MRIMKKNDWSGSVVDWNKKYNLDESEMKIVEAFKAMVKSNFLYDFVIQHDKDKRGFAKLMGMEVGGRSSGEEGADIISK